MKKIIILLALSVLLITVSGCSIINPTSNKTTGTTATASTSPSGTTTIEPNWLPTSTSPHTDTPISELPAGFFLEKPIPYGQSAINQDGIQITVLSYITGDPAWQIIKNASPANIPPAADAQYVLVTLKVKSISSHGEPYQFWGTYFDLVADSAKVYRSRDANVNVIYPASGQYQKLEASLNHGDEFTGSVYFYILKGEISLTLVWSNINNLYKLYFAVK